MTSQKPAMRRRILALLMLPVVAVLAGCFRMDMGITINSDETVDVSMEIVDQSGMFLGAAGQGSCSDLDQGAPADLDYSVEEFDEDGDPGCRLVVNGAPLAELQQGDGISITRDGDVYTFELEGDDTGMMGELGDLSGAGSAAPQVSLSVTFPGEVIEAGGGEVDGNTVTWSDLEVFVTGATATGSAVDGGGSSNLVLIIAIVAGVIVIGAVIAIVVISSKNKKKDASGAPAGAPSAPYGGPGPVAPQFGDAPQSQAYGQPQTPPEGQQYGQQPPAAPYSAPSPQPPTADSADHPGPEDQQPR